MRLRVEDSGRIRFSCRPGTTVLHAKGGTGTSGYICRVQESARPDLRRIQLTVSAVTVGLLVFSLTPLGQTEDPSWLLSVVLKSAYPLLAIAMGLAFAVQKRFGRRDWLAFGVTLATTCVVAAGGVAVDQHLDASDVLLELGGLMLGATAIAVIWSAIGRHGRQ